jgi:general secretion pathway protein M
MNLAQANTWWASLPDRDKALIKAALILVLALLLWLVALSPALRTIRSFDAKHKAQEMQLQRMLNLQAQAQSMQNLPRVSQAAAVTALEASIDQTFGNRAEIVFSGGNATVNVRGVSPEDLAKWLANVRANARTVAIQARLTRTNAGWNGSFQMVLPAQ